MIRSNHFRPAALAAMLALGASGAMATNGYFAHGYGIKSQGMGGAVTALAQDGFAGANNPAAAAFAGDRLDIGASLFNPERSASRTGGASADSGHELFLIPEFGYNRRLDDRTAIGLTVHGNGGMNTSYPANQPGGTNLLNGSGKLGVDMSQLIVAPTLAYQLDSNHAVGVSPLLVYQRFAARGLDSFGGMSSDSTRLTNQGHDSSTGIGLRLGYQGRISDSVRVGAAWSPRVEMSRFEKYQGLFAGQGGFDLPENVNLGVAWQATPALLLALDYQRINYSGVPSVGGTSQVNPARNPLGSANGAGFGWRDIEVWKLGAQWQANADWTLRAGVNRGQNPVTAADVTFNILAPGVMTTHWTLGASYRLSDSDELSFSYMRAPEQSVSGVSMFGGVETIRMKQQLLGVQFSRRF